MGKVIIFAVPYHATSEAAKEIGSTADGEMLIDVTNTLDQNGNLAVGFTTSAAEELQKLLPKTRVVKAFNTVFSQNQSTGRVGKEQLTAFIASDDRMAKQIVMELSRDIGVEPVDVGPLKSARYLEPMAIMIIELGYNLKMGTRIGFRLVKA